MEGHQHGAGEPETEGWRRRIDALADLSGAALQGLDLEELFEQVCSCSRTVLEQDYCCLLKAEDGTEQLVLWSASGWPPSAIGARTVEVSERTQPGCTYLRREPITVTDIREDARFDPALLDEQDRPSGITSIVWGSDQPWGVLGVHFDEPRGFRRDDPAFVEAIGHVLGRGFERRATQEQLEAYADELERANEELEQFAHIVSHDLQEPIRNTHVYLDMLEDRYGDELDEEGRELFGYAREGARRAQNMIQGLRRYTRLETRDSRSEPVDTQALLDDLLRSMGATVDETDAEIEYEDLPTVEADPAQLGQVFQNLLANAIKFAKPDRNPEIEIRTEEVGDRWRFSVQDHGVGMDQQEVDELFQIFRQGSHEEVEDGAGIGLAVCKKIVQRHGGRIWVDTRPGEGSTFHFTMPKPEEGGHGATSEGTESGT